MNIKKTLFALSLLCSTIVQGHNFEVDGIYYNIIDKKNVSVAYKGNSYDEFKNEYTDRVVIPEEVTYNGTTYCVKYIGNSAFRACTELTYVKIPNSVTIIIDNAFYGCTSLNTVSIGSSAAQILPAAFYNCTALKNIISHSETPPNISGADIFAGIDNYNCILHIPQKSIYTYSIQTGWNTFYNIKAIVNVSSISLNHTNINMSVGEVLDLTATVTPDNVTEATASWTTSNPDIATAKDGVITAISSGTATITATAGECSASCIITVVEEETPTEITITMNEYGSATFCSRYALDFRNCKELKVYTATGYNTSTQIVTLMRVQTAEEGCGLFLIAEPGEYTVPVIEKSDDYALNMLVGTLENSIINSTSDDGLYANFKYTIKSGNNKPEFYRFQDNSTLAAGKAYLQLPVHFFPSVAAKSIGIRFDEGTTTDIETAGTKDKPDIYDLTGRKIGKAGIPGIYIINGEKRLVK